MNTDPYSATARWTGGWDEPGLVVWAEDLRARLGKNPVSLGLLFTTQQYFEHAKSLLELLRVHAQIPVLVGCSSYGLVEGGVEHETDGGIVLGLFSLPGSTVQSFIVPPSGENLTFPKLDAAQISGWFCFLEPFHTDAEGWIEAWQDAFPDVPVYGGLAAAAASDSDIQVYRDGEVIERGGVAMALSGVRIIGMAAQGCTPIGETWTITQVERNIVNRIGNRPAASVLEETFEKLPEEMRRRSQGNLFAGLVVDEYKEEFRRGDFLVRNLLGADPKSGALAIGALPRQGQTLQFQLRDAVAADDDVREWLEYLREQVGHSHVYGGCLCVCGGRGQSLFRVENHDAELVQKYLGPVGIVGMFCNGEFAPVGTKSYVHGYTASLILFVGPERTEEDDL
jgi:small ligand-binding sensory domain FIST